MHATTESSLNCKPPIQCQQDHSPKSIPENDSFNLKHWKMSSCSACSPASFLMLVLTGNVPSERTTYETYWLPKFLFQYPYSYCCNWLNYVGVHNVDCNCCDLSLKQDDIGNVWILDALSRTSIRSSPKHQTPTNSAEIKYDSSINL